MAGRFAYKNGDLYEGDFSNGKKIGQGCYYQKDGSVYEGGWTDDKMHGQGKFKWATGDMAGDQYEGQWKHGKRHGQGTYTYASGDFYLGSWRDDIMDGKGQYQRVMQVQVGGAGGSQLPAALADQTPIKVTQHAIGSTLPTIKRDGGGGGGAGGPGGASDVHLPPIDAH